MIESFELFDTLPAGFVPEVCPKGGTTYLYVWDEEKKKGLYIEY